MKTKKLLIFPSLLSLLDFQCFGAASAEDENWVEPGRFVIESPTLCILPNINDQFSDKAPDLGASEMGRPLPVYGPRA